MARPLSLLPLAMCLQSAAALGAPSPPPRGSQPTGRVAADVDLRLGGYRWPGCCNNLSTGPLAGVGAAVGWQFSPTTAVMLRGHLTLRPGALLVSGVDVAAGAFVGPTVRWAASDTVRIHAGLGLSAKAFSSDYGSSVIGLGGLARVERVWGAFALGVETTLEIVGKSHYYDHDGTSRWPELLLTASLAR